MFGGLARHETMTPDGFATVVCHELGHHLGGVPKKFSWFGNSWASNEGQADYFGIMKCLRKMFEHEDNVKIVKEIDDKARYDDAAQTKTLIVMQILGNTKTFFDAQSTIVDTDINDYLSVTIEDQYGMLFDMAQENTIQEMINRQY